MLIDITRTLGLDDRAYPGDVGFKLTRVCDAASEGYTLTEFHGTLHCGTHFDAPAHFFHDGATIDQLPLERFDLPALIVECGQADNVTADQLVGLDLPRDGAVLFRTRNRSLPRDRYTPNHCAVSEDAAAALLTAGVSMVGIDYISVERGTNPAFPVHKLLLRAGVLLLEDVDLRLVIPGPYRLRCYPLKIHGAEAAPCRAMLSAL